MRSILKLAASVSLAFVAGSVSGLAQDSSQKTGVAGMEGLSPGSKPTAVFQSQRLAGPCPVSLHAMHGADGGIRNVDKSKPEGVAQLLHLILTSKDSRQIVEARLRVRGVSPKARVSNADLADGANAPRFVAVRFRQSGDKEATGNAWVPGLSAVLAVELNGITFSDGNMQHFSQADGCRFLPDHLMLIAKDGN